MKTNKGSAWNLYQSDVKEDMLKVALSHLFPMFSGIDWICGGAEEFTVGALRNRQQCRQRNPQQYRTVAIWNGYRRNNYTDCLLCTIFVALSDGYM